jgi:dUTP pyrophosphatase
VGFKKKRRRFILNQLFLNMKIAVIRDVKVPVRGTDKSAGIDFFVPNDYKGKTKLTPGESVLIPSGIRANVPAGFMLTAFNKSGVATKKSLIVGAAVVDEDYQGEIHIHLLNAGEDVATFEAGDKIVQFILVPVSYLNVEVVDNTILFAEASQRGEGGFGSTGTK